ncbi:MAG TPA: arginine decarboxylase, partial [Saprospirales bacterium]|nr:arginine decarboxylase [Saprospirales bacterium]
MKNTYFDLIDQSYYFPHSGFDMRNGYLSFHGISLKYLIEKYGTPFRLMYLPGIANQIKKAKNLFARGIKKNSYKGKYHYCYCTKCNHFSYVLETVLKEGVQLETSSSFDLDLIWNLYKKGKVAKDVIIVHNGYKTESYLEKIVML